MFTHLKAFVAALIIGASPSYIYAQSFEDISAGLDPLSGGRMNWADLDNDGDLDIIYSGTSGDASQTFYTRVYENNGGTFVLRTTNLPHLRNGEITPGDFDKDGDADMLLSGYTVAGNTSAIYENKGAFDFVLKQSLDGILNATPSWTDIDNDEDLDVVIAGDDDTGSAEPFVNRIFVYRNNGSTFTPLTSTNLPPCSQCAMDWADVNNDGYTDVVIANITSTEGNSTAIYTNQHDGTFGFDVLLPAPLLYNGDVRFGDYDRDGDMDIVLSGARENGTITTDVYENRGGSFVWRDDLDLYYVGENHHRGTRWIDYNNDGWPDLVLTGRGTSVDDQEYVFKFFRNTRDGYFEEEDAFELNGLADTSVDYGDFDNDGDVDIAYMGLDEQGIRTGILRNQLLSGPFAANTRPLPPTGLSESFYRGDVHLSWMDGSDAITPTPGLSYNFYLQKGTGKSFIPASNLATGYVMADNPANGHARRVMIPGLAEGNYSWAVQSVDGARAGSSFTAAKTFYKLNGPAANELVIVDPQHVKLTWTDQSALETSYRIERSVDPATSFSTRATLGANVATYTDNFAFVPETAYYYRIYAVNSVRSSGYDSLMFLLSAGPENLYARETHAARVALAWDDMSAFETGYVVERRLASGATFEVLDTLGADVVDFADHGLAEATGYVYRVRALNEYGYSAYSNELTLKTNTRPRGGDLARTGIEDTNIPFTEQEFVDKFSDSDTDDFFTSIYIGALPDRGTLKAGTTLVTAGQRVSRGLLSSLVYSPSADENGTHVINFYYSDGKDSSDVAYKVVMELDAVNDAPVFAFPAKIILDEDFTARTILPDMHIPTDELSQAMTWTIEPTEVTGITVALNSATGALALTPVQDAYGSWTFTIHVDDGQAQNNTHTATVEVVVNSVNDAPQIALINDIAVEKAQPVPPVTLVVTDSDSPVENTLFVVTSDNQAVIKNRNLSIVDFVLHMKPEQKMGKAVITIKASDGVSESTTQFTLEILTITAIEKKARGVDVYPNPVAGALSISIDKTFTPPFSISVRDAVGREVLNTTMESDQAKLDFSGFGAGMYFVKIVTLKNKVLFEGRVVKK